MKKLLLVINKVISFRNCFSKSLHAINILTIVTNTATINIESEEYLNISAKQEIPQQDFDKGEQ